MPKPDRFLLGLGSRVRELRKAAGLTQDALAERSGISAKYVSEIETGAVNASIGVVQRLARDGFQVPLSALVNFGLPDDEAAAIHEEIAGLVLGADLEARRRALAALRAFLLPYPPIERPDAGRVPLAAEPGLHRSGRPVTRRRSPR